MPKKKIYLAMLALASQLYLTGCMQDGKDGSDADASAAIADLQEQLNEGLITISEYEDQIADLQDQLSSAQLAQVESCSVCHTSEKIQSVHALPATIAISNTSAADDATNDTATLTFTLTYNGEAVTDVAAIERQYAYYHDDSLANRGFNRVSYPASDVALTSLGNGSYSVTFSNFTADAANATLGTTPVRLMIAGQSAIAGGFTVSADTNNGVQGLFVDGNSCTRCHDSVFDTTESSHHGAYAPQGDQCVVCHSRYNGGTDTEAGHRLTNYVHGIHNSENMEGEEFTRFSGSSGAQTAADTYKVGFPTNMADCVMCHTTDDQIAAVTSNEQMNLTLCKSCHRNGDSNVWDSADANYTSSIEEVWQAIPFPNDSVRDLHDSMPESTSCLNSSCHGNAALNLNEIHSGESKPKELGKNIHYFTPEMTYDSETGKLTIVWGAYQDNDENGSYDEGVDTKLDVTNRTDTTQPIFMTAYAERVLDGGVNTVSDGAQVKIAYYGYSSKDSVYYDGFYPTEEGLLTTDSTASGYTTYDSSTGMATTIDYMNQDVITEYKVIGGRVAIVGIPQVDGENAYVKSVSAEFHLDNTEVTDAREVKVNMDKCDACHNGVKAHFDSHGHTAIGDLNACEVCHRINVTALFFAEQPKTMKSYIHTIHIGQAARPAFSALQAEYPKNPADCEACHDAGTYDIPDQTAELPAPISGLEFAGGDTSGITYGPAATACGGCHRGAAYQNYVDGDSAALSELNSINAHFKTFGYGVNTDDMSWTDVVTRVKELLGETDTE